MVIRLCRLVFMLICCSTEANSTNCCVNWLVSSGSSGFWFCSCVVRSCRNVLKLPASCCEAVVPAAWAVDEVDEPEDVVLTWLGEKTEAALDVVLMGLILRHERLNANIEAAAETRARVNLRCGGRREIGVGNHELRIAAGL